MHDDHVIVIVALTSLSLSIIVRHMQGDHKANSTTSAAVLQLVLNINASFQVCLQSAAEGNGKENNKKSPDKALAQLVTSLQSKQWKRCLNAFLKR